MSELRISYLTQGSSTAASEMAAIDELSTPLSLGLSHGSSIFVYLRDQQVKNNVVSSSNRGRENYECPFAMRSCAGTKGDRCASCRNAGILKKGAVSNVVSSSNRGRDNYECPFAWRSCAGTKGDRCASCRKAGILKQVM